MWSKTESFLNECLFHGSCVGAESEKLLQKTLGNDPPPHLSDVLVSVSKAEQEVWQHMDHIRLKQLPQHVTQHLKGKQRSCRDKQLVSGFLFFFKKILSVALVLSASSWWLLLVLVW